MNNPPFLSVIIPTFNRASLLPAAVTSVLGQQGGIGVELIVVDDGSTDGTIEYLKTQAGRLRYFSQPNRGPGAARNLGALHAAGEYLAFLDSDDRWFPWTAATYRETATTAGNPAIITGRHFVFAGEQSIHAVSQEALSYRRFPDYFASAEDWLWYGASSFVIRRDYFAAAGGFNEARGAEDAELMMRLGTAPGFIHIDRPFTFAYLAQLESLKSDMTYLIQGNEVLIKGEQAGLFPGGSGRLIERVRIITRAVRPVTLFCLERDYSAVAWAHYRAAFRWHLALWRWKYLLGFPVKAMLAGCASVFGKLRPMAKKRQAAGDTPS